MQNLEFMVRKDEFLKDIQDGNINKGSQALLKIIKTLQNESAH